MQAFSEIFFNEFMADKFGILVQNDILRQCITVGSPVYQVVFRKVLD